MSTKVPQNEVDEFKKAIELAMAKAKPLTKYNKRDVDDSEVKFLLIRAIRMEHLGREVTSGKSQRT